MGDVRSTRRESPAMKELVLRARARLIRPLPVRAWHLQQQQTLSSPDPAVIFEPTKLQDAYVLDLERREDERGFFARAWCQREFEARGLVTDLVQANIAYNVCR